MVPKRTPDGVRTDRVAALTAPAAGHGVRAVVPAAEAPVATLAMAATAAGEATEARVEARVVGSRAGIVIRDTIIAFMFPTTRAVVLMAATVQVVVRAVAR